MSIGTDQIGATTNSEKKHAADRQRATVVRSSVSTTGMRKQKAPSMPTTMRLRRATCRLPVRRYSQSLIAPPTVAPIIPPNSTPDENKAECFRSRWKFLKKKDGSQVKKTQSLQPKQKAPAVTGTMRPASLNQGTDDSLPLESRDGAGGSRVSSSAVSFLCLRGSSRK